MVTRVLPKPTVSRDDATHLAWKHGWLYDDMLLNDGEQPFEKIWLTHDGSTSIHWIEDHVLELDYFAVQGERRDEIAQAIRDDVETYDRDELRKMVESTEDWDDLSVALQHAAVAAPPEFDSEFFGWFERGFAHENPTLRKMTMILTSYQPWAEFREPLERLRGNDDAEMRDVAEKMLKRLPATNGGDA